MSDTVSNGRWIPFALPVLALGLLGAAFFLTRYVLERPVF